MTNPTTIDTIDTLDTINRLVAQTRALLSSLGDTADGNGDRVLSDGLWLAEDQLVRMKKEIRTLEALTAAEKPGSNTPQTGR